MGLDMWLIKKNENGDEEELSYWRKANAIHNWFVENIQDGIDDQSYYNITKEQLSELLDVCNDVMNNMITDNNGNIINKNDIKKILPTREGFFFGSYNYDEYYIEDIKYTIEQINHIFETVNFNKDKIYYTCWW